MGFLSNLLLAAALSLGGVTGESLKARAFFDVNNAKVGDPLVLTIDFIGTADFALLHPPSLARAVDGRDWKLDASSARTDTFRDAKRLTWRVRPRRAGVLWFPALAFTYSDATGALRTVTANAIPVHAKPGADVDVAEMGRDETAMPQPDELIVAPPELAGLSDDARFAWRRACAKPTADAFAAFDFPAAKLNEARCAILAGDWQRALGVYTRLEWRTGQTPAIERGLLAALALRYENPLVELPVWRQVGRPLLKYGWRGRVGWVAGSVVSAVLVLLLLGRLVRALAVLAFAALLPLATAAETVTTTTTNANGSVTVETVERDANGQVVARRVSTSSSGGSSFSFSSSSGGALRPMSGGGSLFGGRDPFAMFDDFDPFGSRRRARARYPKVEIGVSLVADKPSVTVGEDFNLILTLDTPQFISFADGIRFALEEQDAFVQTAQPQTLQPVRSPNPTNILQRIAFPMRANRPIRDLRYSVASSYLYRGENSFFAQATPWASGTRAARLVAHAPPAAGRPADWGGLVATSLRLSESCDLVRPETNDVVTVTYRLDWKGYVPPDWMPPDAAYEWGRNVEGAGGSAEWRRYVVADGVEATPKISVAWYDPKLKRYRRTEAGGTTLFYRPVGDASTTDSK